MGIQSDGSRRDIVAHYNEFRTKYAQWYGENVSIGDEKHAGDLQSLERLQSLQSLQTTAKDYADIEILPNSVVYCDIPYENTNGYGLDDSKDNFDHARFYEWALSRKFPVFISSYSLPDDFGLIAEKGKRVSMSSTNNSNIAREGIYVQRKFQQQFKRDLFL